MTVTQDEIKRIFPDYFNRFTMPEGVREERILVYRACKTGKCDKISFTPSFEEKGYQYGLEEEPTDPILYSLSTYEKPKDVKRFVTMSSEYNIPYTIAKGITEPRHGLVQRTKERATTKNGKKSSHVDWWLYVDAKPYLEFEIIEDFEKYIEEYGQGGGANEEILIS